MREHEQFGRPPNLRPRSAGVAPVTSRSVGPDQLADEAVRSGAASVLIERLQLPRPGSATAVVPARLPMSPSQGFATSVAVQQSAELKPTVLLSKPPTRPRSAMFGSRGNISLHRMEMLQSAMANHNSHVSAETSAVGPPIQSKEFVPQLQRVPPKVDTGDKERWSSGASQRRARTTLKQPFSATPTTAAPQSMGQRRRNDPLSSPCHSSSNQHEQEPHEVHKPASRAKRPFSATPASRGASQRQLIASILSQSGACGAPAENMEEIRTTHSSTTPTPIMSTYHRDTFVYAVPRHCLEHGRHYNPYDILTVPHEVLFGSNLSARELQPSSYDYYTVSSSGMTFYCKNDSFEPTFLTSSEWEREKLCFERLCKLATFQKFRYRKVFLAWRSWIRLGKVEAAKMAMMSSLYFTQPVMCEGMKIIQTELAQLQNINLMCDMGGTTHHMSQFAAKCNDFVQSQGIEILKITCRIQQVLLRVCQECLMSAENPYGGFPGHEFAVSTRKSSNYHIFEAFVERERALATANHQLVQHQHFQMSSGQMQPSSVSVSMAAQLRTTHRKYIERVIRAQQQRPKDTLEEIRWTLAAIQRRRCLLLSKFVSLVDFMVMDSMHSMIQRSVQLLRDSLCAGANAVPISKLVEREDYTLAFHRTVGKVWDTTESVPTGEIAKPDKFNSPRRQPLHLNKQQTKQFLRTVWEVKIPKLSFRRPKDSPELSSQDQKASSTVRLESRLDSFITQALRARCGDVEVYSQEDFTFVIERTLASALVLPDFAASRCMITKSPFQDSRDDCEEDESLNKTAKDIAQFDALSPVPLLHVSLNLQVDECSKVGSIGFKPALDHIPSLLEDIVSSFVEVFRGIPSVVLHNELLAVLEFAEDFRSPSIAQERDGVNISTAVKSQTANGENDESPWNKSNYERLLARVGNDPSCLALRININSLMNSAIAGAEALACLYNETLATYTRNENISFESYQARYRDGEYSIRGMEEDVLRFKCTSEDIQSLKESQAVEFLLCDVNQLKSALSPSPARCLQVLRDLFPQLALERCESFRVKTRNSGLKIEKPSLKDNLEAFAHYLLNLQEVQKEVDEQEFSLVFLQELFLMFERLGIEVPSSISQVFDLCEPEFAALRAQLDVALSKRDSDIQERSPILLDKVKQLIRNVETLKNSSADQAINSAESMSNEARDLANTLEKQAGELLDQSAQLVWVQRVFSEYAHGSRPPLEEFGELQLVSSEIKLKNEMWEAVNDAEDYLDAKRDETLRLIDLAQLKSLLAKIDAVIKRLEHRGVQVAAMKRVESCKAVFEGLTPVIRDLRNENLDERHWAKLEHKINCSFVRYSTVSQDDDNRTSSSRPTAVEMKYLDLPLRHLLEIEAVNHAAIIHQVSEEATAEAAIVKSFQSVSKTWETREIPSFHKKDRDGRDVICLGDCTELVALVEESEVLLRVMDSSSYARVIQSKVTRLLQDLSHAKETIDLLVICQQKREHLQHLISPDFARSFPEESKRLQMHDGKWKAIMEGVMRRPLCLLFGTNTENRQILQSIFQGFEYAAMYLEQHLEMKRGSFPAFYKLSNTELASLLSKVRDINNIQQFLYQCFDNVSRIDFGTREECQDILSISSRSFPRTETISMGRNLKARGPPEQWLAGVEKRLIEVLRKSTKEAVFMLSQASTPTAASFDTASLQALPLQCVLLANRILHCELVDSLLVDEQGSASRATSVFSARSSIYARLKQLHATTIKRVAGVEEGLQLAEMTPRDLILTSCLRLHEIEFRDAVDEHFVAVSDCGSSNAECAFGMGIDWMMQLKHRFDDSTTVGYDCHVEMDGSRFAYGFNYVNDNAELVFTPRSMRFVFSVYAATRHGQVALLGGPSGSGKRSLACQISRLFGRRIFGTDVSESSTSGYLQLAHSLKLIRGSLLAGGVLCISVQPQEDIVAMFRLLNPVLLKVQLCALSKIPLTEFQREPGQWIPGTTLIFTYDHPTPSCSLSLQQQRDLDLVTGGLARITVAMNHDMAVIFEALLYSKHLEAPKDTARKLNFLWNHLNAIELISHGNKGQPTPSIFSVQSAKHVITKVAQDLSKTSEAFQREELQSYLICEAIIQFCSPVIEVRGGDYQRLVCDALDQFFEYRHHAREWYTKQWIRRKNSSNELESRELEELLVDAAQECHFLPRRQLIAKSIEVANGLCSSVGVIAVGPSGAGKGATLEVLSLALSKWKNGLAVESASRVEPNFEIRHSQPSVRLDKGVQPHSALASVTPESPFVTVRIVLPMSLTLAQLYGSTNTDPKGQIKSLLGRYVRDAQELYGLSTDHEIRRILQSSPGSATFGSMLAMQKLVWIVFDGGATCCGSWLDVILSALARKHVFGLIDACDSPCRELIRFHDGDFMTIPPNLRFIFDTWNLRNATPAILQYCSVAVFAPAEHIAVDDEDDVPIHLACVHRFLERQRLGGLYSTDGDRYPPPLAKLSGLVYGTVASRLLETDILGQLFTIMEDYGVTIHISIVLRVEYMLSLLQAMLSGVAASCSASLKTDTSSLNAKSVIPEDDIRHRVEMAIVYALLWGFCTCCVSVGDVSGSRALQQLVSKKIKKTFDSIHYVWEDCGRDANLFELLIDLNGLRFVSLDSGNALILRDKLWRHHVGSSGSDGPVSNSDKQLHALFVPTHSSLVVHAAMRESARSARGILLVGGDTSRKTTLLQNYLRQLESIKVLTTSDYASIPAPAPAPLGGEPTEGIPKRKRGAAHIQIPLFSNTDNPYASLDRIRMHQVGLVKRLAKRFRRVNKAATDAAAVNAAQRYGASKGRGNEAEGNNAENSKTLKRNTAWALQPHLQPNKSSMVSKFDLGDFIPFFFAMNQADRGVDGLAKCLERMLQRERSGIFEPPPGKVAVFIIDDLHLPVMTHDEESPSCHEYLRSVHEHNSVLSQPTNELGAAPTTIENLMMVASMSAHAMSAMASNASEGLALKTNHYSLDKLIKQFIPVYASENSLPDLHTIFHMIVMAHWELFSTSSLGKISTTVRQIFPIIVAATTVLWEKLRRRACSIDDNCALVGFNLHDLSRLYTSICAVEPSFILDVDTMTRLWAHEVVKSFGVLPWPDWKSHVQAEVYRVRILLDGIDPHQQFHGSAIGTPSPKNALTTINANSASKVAPAVGSTSFMSHDVREMTRTTNLNTATNLHGLLAFFSGELLEQSSAKASGSDLILSSQQIAAYQRKKLHIVPAWAFVLSSLYYQTAPGGEETADSGEHPPPLQRRNSIKFIRRKTLGNVVEAMVAGGVQSRTASLGNARWMYCELPLLVDGTSIPDDGGNRSFEPMFAAVRVFGLQPTGLMEVKPVTDISFQVLLTQLPRSAPSVTPLVATNIANLDRVFAPQGSRCVLLAPSGSGRDLLLGFACAVRQTSQPQSIWTMEGVPHYDTMAKRWKHIAFQLFHRVGVEFEGATLVVKRLQYWPKPLISQLLALIVAGEIPGAFNLDEQIRLACRVRDERLIELEQRYQANVARVRQEVEMEKDHEMLAIREQKELPKSSAATFYHELERKYQHILSIRLSQVQLRHQQDLDDLLRKCEVESESVTATIMSLMRPLGMTSGRWQQIVQRMRQRLKVVIMVDCDEYQAVSSVIPQILRICNVASLSTLDVPSLQVLLYSSFRNEVQNTVRDRMPKRTDGSSEGFDSRADLTQFMDQVEHELTKIVAFAAEIHNSAKNHAAGQNRKLSTEYAISTARFFARFLWSYYFEERERRRKTERFMYVYTSMEKALWRLQDRDGELKEQLESCDQQIEVSQELLVEQKADCDRIRDMMKRYQENAEEQVQVTNEMELRAQAELHVPMACLEEANAALLLIDKRHIIEIKSFSSPPLLVHLVLDAMCVMFQLEPVWENARKILSDPNVVHTLLAFDKDRISDEIVEKLGTTYINDTRFHREEVEKQSVAASMMVVWVRAMYQYATARRQVMPTLQKLEQAQSRLRLLMQEYQVSKQRVVEADEALAKTKTTLEQAHLLRRQTVEEMESRKTRLDGGRVVLDVLGEDKREAEITSERLEKERQHGLSWWNALLTAASMAYASHFDTNDRLHLYEVWRNIYLRDYSRTSGENETSRDIEFQFIPTISIRIRENYVESNLKNADDHAAPASASPRDPLNVFCDREQAWQIPSACGYLFSERNLQDAALLTEATVAGFPVVMITSYTNEMEDLLVTCARSVWKWSKFFMVSANASDLTSTVMTAVQEGQQLLILDVDPLDVEFKLGKLWELFHWSTQPSAEGGESTVDHLILAKDDSSPLTDASSDNDGSNSTLVPVHKSFRAVLSSYQNASAFGDSLMTRIPVISAQLHFSEISGTILDKLWYPGHFEGGQHGFGLKQSVRDFERLSMQHKDAETQLIQLIQGAAVRGQFQREETDLIRAASAKTQQIRDGLRHKRVEIQERIQAVEKQSAIARLGAALFSGINSTADSAAMGEIDGELLSLHLFVPMFLLAVRRPHGIMANASQPPPTRNPSSGGQGFMLCASSKSGVVGLHQQQRSFTAVGAATAKIGGFDTIGEIVQKILRQLMPLVQDATSWYKFVAHMLWFLELQNPVDHKICNSPALEAINKALETTNSNEQLRLRHLLALAKLSHWTSQAECSDYEMLLQSRSDVETVVSLVVSGHSTVRGMPDAERVDSSDLSTVFAASRCRAERFKTALSVYPQLVRPICDKILQVYGVQVRFSSFDTQELDYEAQPSTLPLKESASRRLSNLIQGHADELLGEDCDESAYQSGVLRVVGGFPATASVVAKTSSSLGGFDILQRLFFATTCFRDNALDILKAAFARSFVSSKQLETVFLLPNARLSSGILGGDRRQETILMAECALMVNDSDLFQVEREKLESLLEDVPLTIVNIQHTAETAKMRRKWEELHHLINASPERTTSTELQRFEVSTTSTLRTGSASTAQENPNVSSSSVSLSVPSRGAPTARRFSTHGLQHRRSNAAAMFANTSVASFIIMTNESGTIPWHLRANTAVIHWDSTELGSGCTPTLKRCLQAVLIRVAFHPCADTIRQILTGQESDTTAKTTRGAAVESAQDFGWLGRQLWHHLTVLSVYHAILMYRRQLSLLQYTRTSIAEIAAEEYSWDVFISALDQLLFLFIQARAPAKSASPPSPQERSENLLMRTHHQVYMVNYSRQARTQQELVVLSLLCGDCINLVREASLTPTVPSFQFAPSTRSPFTALQAPGISSSRSARSHRILNVAGSLQSLLAGPTPPSHSASSRKIIDRQSSGGTASLLTGMNLPLEALRNSVEDADSWFDMLWTYAERIDGTVKTLTRDFFGLLPPAEGNQSPCPDTTLAWVELFGWIRQPVRYGSVASQILVDDALRCLQLVNEKILPPDISLGDSRDNANAIASDNHKSGDSEDDSSDDEAAGTRGVPQGAYGEPSADETEPPSSRSAESTASHTLGATPPNPAGDSRAVSTQEQCLRSFVSCYNSHVIAVRTSVQELLKELLYWKSLHLSDEQQTLASVADAQTRSEVLAVLCNQLPARLRDRMVASPPTYLLATADVTLDALLTHHRRWQRDLEQQRAPRPWVQWWLPSVPARASVGYLVELARRRISADQPAAPTHPEDLVFSLRVETADGEADRDESQSVPEGTFAVLCGLELRLARWDLERGYLQALDRHSPREPQRVSVLCQCATPKELPSHVAGSKLRRTRSCPLLTRGGVALELELPVGPAVGTLVAPYLTLAPS